MSIIAPTKSNFLKVKDELKFARQGYELLDQKRNILVMELLNLVDQTEAFQTRVEEALNLAYRNLEEAVLRMGKRRVTSLSESINVTSEIKLGKRKVMGVQLPVVNTEFSGVGPFFSPVGTSSYVDEGIRLFQEALKEMGHLSELKISIMRLAREVKKTIRKVNALEKIAIPDLEESLKSISDRLEEQERENMMLLKSVKARLEARLEAKSR
jgi:V/A-type H+-transporting ATPase subunit D